MKCFCASLLLGLFAFSGYSGSADIVNLPSMVAGQERTAALYVPKNYDPAQEWPLLVYLHGGGRGGVAMPPAPAPTCTTLSPD